MKRGSLKPRYAAKRLAKGIMTRYAPDVIDDIVIVLLDLLKKSKIRK